MEISVVVPLLNEEDNIERLYVELISVFKILEVEYELIFVDDGSTDHSFERIEKLKLVDNRIHGISFSRNFGHQAALMAGIAYAKGDVIVSMDADLQHPPSIIAELYEKYKAGFEIVNTKRLSTMDSSVFKRASSAFFYKLINVMSDVHIESASADFRLMSRKAALALCEIKEKDRFTRGLVSWLGFNQTYIEYIAPSRAYGKSKFTVKKMIRYAISGITSFSSKPLRLSLYSGIFVSLLAMVYGFYAIWENIHGKTIQGWTSILLSVLFIGGIQLITLGIFGEYLSKIFIEIKNRPLYIINKTTDN